MFGPKNPETMWNPPEPAPRSWARLVVLLGLIALIAAGFVGWRAYFGPGPSWRRAIQVEDSRKRAALWTLLQREGEIDGLDAKGTIREVFALLTDPDAETRGWAVATVPSIHADPIEAISRIAPRLVDADDSVRVKAATALGEAVRRGEPGHDEAISALARALKDPEPAVRKAAVVSVGQIVFEGGQSTDPLRSRRGEDPALDLLAARLRDDDRGVWIESAHVLASNDRGGEALPRLIREIGGQPLPAPLDYYADRAFLALMVLAVHSEEAISFLISQIPIGREGYPERPRDALAWAARQSPEAHARVRKQAGEAIKSENLFLRYNAAFLLQQIGLGKTALPELIAALKDKSLEIRIKAVEALADLGDVDPVVIPALEMAAQDANAQVRERALGALEAIEFQEMMEALDEGAR
jgi:HEAT repeat protein